MHHEEENQMLKLKNTCCIFSLQHTSCPDDKNDFAVLFKLKELFVVVIVLVLRVFCALQVDHSSGSSA